MIQNHLAMVGTMLDFYATMSQEKFVILMLAEIVDI